MRVLITGSNGFLGNYITKEFEASNYEIFCLNRRQNNIDISKKFVLNESHFDIVIHSAGKAHMYPKTQNEIDQFYLVNYEGTKNLCNALILKNVKQFIFISTVAIYGSKGVNHKESDLPQIESPYADSKLKAEKYLQEWGLEHNIPVIILRLPLIVGLNPPGNLGKMISSMRKGFYVSINNGKCIKSAVLAEDVGRFLKTLNNVNGIYNLSDSIDISFSDFEKYLSKKIGTKYYSINLKIILIFGKIGDLFKSKIINSDLIFRMTQDFTISCTKAQKELGWNPRSIKGNLQLFYK